MVYHRVMLKDRETETKKKTEIKREIDEKKDDQKNEFIIVKIRSSIRWYLKYELRNILCCFFAQVNPSTTAARTIFLNPVIYITKTISVKSVQRRCQ